MEQKKRGRKKLDEATKKKVVTFMVLPALLAEIKKVASRKKLTTSKSACYLMELGLAEEKTNCGGS